MLFVFIERLVKHYKYVLLTISTVVILEDANPQKWC